MDGHEGGITVCGTVFGTFAFDWRVSAPKIRGKGPDGLLVSCGEGDVFAEVLLPGRCSESDVLRLWQGVFVLFFPLMYRRVKFLCPTIARRFS